MRIVSDIKEQNASKQVEEPKKEDKSIKFNNVLVQELGNECYGVNFFSSLGIHKKSCGLCDLAKFFWKISEYTMCIKMKIKEFLLISEFDFTYPQINEVKLNKEESVFKQALIYEDNRIEHLYKIIDVAPCDCTKSFVEKLIYKHVKIKHLLSLANKISEMSDDPLIIQKSIYKLICDEQKH